MGGNNFEVDFIGIGAARCGTTWVSKCLNQHPGIAFSKEVSQKELYFFSSNFGNDIFSQYVPSNFSKGLEWYKKQFPVTNDRKIGEFCVTYFCDKKAPQRIYSFFPKTKIILCIRDPIDMLVSLYSMASNSTPIDVSKDINEVLKTESFLTMGNYYEHLSRYLQYFDFNQIHIIIFDDIISKPEEIVRSLYEFLEVDSSFKPSVLDERINVAVNVKSEFLRKLVYYFFEIVKKLNYSLYLNLRENKLLWEFYKFINLKKERKKPPLRKKTREFLNDYYCEKIYKLQRLINRDLSSWLQ